MRKIILMLTIIIILVITALLISDSNKFLSMAKTPNKDVNEFIVEGKDENKTKKETIANSDKTVDLTEDFENQNVSFTIGATGDMMCHGQQLTDARRSANDLNLEAEFSFDHVYEGIAPALKYPDLMIANFETNIVDNRRYVGYPDFNSPIEFAESAKDAGIDILSNANNHAMDFEYEGLVKTLEALDKVGVEHTGIYSSMEDYYDLLFYEIDDINVCVIGASYLQNRGGLNKFTQIQKEYAAEIIDEPHRIIDKIERAKNEGADLVVLSLHWGDEYSIVPNDYQRKHAETFIAAGADVIFGHHPHLVQPAEIVEATTKSGETKEALVYWSLGNFISNQTLDFRNSGVIAYANFSYNKVEKKVSFVNSVYIPTYVYKAKDTGFQYHILPAGYYTKENDEEFPYIKGTINTYMEESYLNTVAILGNETVKPIGLYDLIKE